MVSPGQRDCVEGDFQRRLFKSDRRNLITLPAPNALSCPPANEHIRWLTCPIPVTRELFGILAPVHDVMVQMDYEAVCRTPNGSGERQEVRESGPDTCSVAFLEHGIAPHGIADLSKDPVGWTLP